VRLSEDLGVGSWNNVLNDRNYLGADAAVEIRINPK
jgi:hypothetical protein